MEGQVDGQCSQERESEQASHSERATAAGAGEAEAASDAVRFVEVVGLAAGAQFDADIPVGLFFSWTHRGIACAHYRREPIDVCFTIL